MFHISDKVKLESVEGIEIFRVPSNLKEDIKLNFDKESFVKFIIEDNTEVKVVVVSKFNKEVEIELGKGSKLNWLELNSGQNIKSKVKTFLNEGSESNFLSVVFGNDKENYEIENSVVHNGSESKSNMIVRAVLNDQSKILQTGLVKVSKGAKNCEGYQKSDSILLSEDAYVESVPNLEIENNEVQCSHGATISQVDKDKLFYLMSRGLSEKEAKKSIIEGFFEPVIKEFDNSLRDELVKKLENGN
jgi:Fe-S cluster assembly scaffold protein SufB